jgi:hypothetical protein
MRNRPEDSVSVTKYLHHFAIISNDPLTESNLQRSLSRASPFLRDSVLRLPLIEEEYGLSMDGYCIVDDNCAVEKVMTEWPLRATLFSTRTGLVFTARKEDVSGFLTREIPKEQRYDILVNRDSKTLSAAIEGGGQL